jgi:signal transduction histidine kinase
LYLRLYLAFVGVLLVVAAASTAVTWWASRAALRAARWNGPALIQHLSYVVTQIPDASTLQQALEKFHENLDVDVALYDVGGRRFARIGEPIAQPDESIFPLLKRKEVWLPEPYVIGGPLYSRGGCWGVILLRLRGLEASQRNVLLPILFLVGGLLLALALVYPLSRSITRPLERLSAAVDEFGKGQLSTRSGIRQNDEVGLLARSFDQMADRIQAARRTEKELLSNVSHELRTPLARVRVALGLIESPPEATQRRLAVVEEELDELERLITQVLTASKLDLAALAVRKESLSVRELVQKSCERTQALEPEREIQMEVPESLTLAGDGTLLSRAIENLLDNARKYDTSGRPIRVEASRNGEGVVLSVTDHGPGIPTEDLDRIFEPFFRSTSTRGRAPGFGLGLSLARRVAEAHGGAIRALNMQDGGARIEIRLPG